MEIFKMKKLVEKFFADSTGIETFVLTDGKECLFTSEEVKLGNNEALFYCESEMGEPKIRLIKTGDYKKEN